MKLLSTRFMGGLFGVFSKIYFVYAALSGLLLVTLILGLSMIYFIQLFPDWEIHEIIRQAWSEHKIDVSKTFTWRANLSGLLSNFCGFVSALLAGLIWGSFASLAKGWGSLMQQQILQKIRFLPVWFLGLYTIDVLDFVASKIAFGMNTNLHELLSHHHFGWVGRFLLPSFHGASSLIFALLALIVIRVLSKNLATELKLKALENEAQLIV